MIEVIPGVYHLNNRFVNLYLIAEADGLTLIDAGIANSAPKLVLAAIAKLGRLPSDLRCILITHADADHYGGANALRQHTGARVLASAVEAEAMAQGRSSREFKGNAVVRALFGLAGVVMPVSPTSVDEVLAPGQVLPVLDELRVIASPGHTPGHLSFYAPTRRLLFAGDSLNAMGGKLRFVNGPVTWDYARGMQSVREQAALGAEWICVGHGPVLPGQALLQLAALAA